MACAFIYNADAGTASLGALEPARIDQGETLELTPLRRLW